MEPDESTASFPRRHELAAKLRERRDLAGISGRALARRIGVSQSKVSRIESGSAVPSLPEVEAWSRALGLDEEIRQQLTVMTKAAHTEALSWRSALAGKGHVQDDILRQESEARKVRVCQTAVVPGLLQTPDYARAVFTLAGGPTTEADRAAAVAARMDRQIQMYEGRREYEFIVTEAALRWRPGSYRMLAAQVERIAHLGTLGNVTIGVVPLMARATTILSHGFALYDLEQSRRATVEALHAHVTVQGVDEVEVYHEHWFRLAQMALSESDSQRLLQALAEEYRGCAEREQQEVPDGE